MFDWITDGFKEWIVDGIVAVFENFFIAGSIENAGSLLNQTPTGFSALSLEMVENINTYVILPVAGLILTYVMVTELIHLVLDHNSMYEHSTYTIYKWLFKTCLAIILVANAFTITTAIVEAGASLVSDAIPYATGAEGSSLLEMRDGLMEFSIGELLVTYFAVLVSGMGMWICQILIWAVLIVRFMSIYMNLSVASIPFATLTNSQLNNTGVNYIKNIIGIGLQGVIIIVALAVYGTISATPLEFGSGLEGIAGIISAAFRPFILLLALVIVIMKSKSISNSIVGAF